MTDRTHEDEKSQTVGQSDLSALLCVAVPKKDITAIECARLELYELAETQGWGKNPRIMTALMGTTEPMWKISHKKYANIQQP